MGDLRTVGLIPEFPTEKTYKYRAFIVCFFFSPFEKRKIKAVSRASSDAFACVQMHDNLRRIDRPRSLVSFADRK